MLLEDFKNAKHLFINGGTFDLSCWRILREEGQGVVVLLDDSACLQIRCICADVLWNIGISKRWKDIFCNQSFDCIEG